jgi:hypothetical protein
MSFSVLNKMQHFDFKWKNQISLNNSLSSVTQPQEKEEKCL